MQRKEETDDLNAGNVTDRTKIEDESPLPLRERLSLDAISGEYVDGQVN